MVLQLNDIADVSYELSPVSTPRRGFDVNLIIGTSAVLTTTTRIATYQSLTEMVTAGFTTNSAEYLAAVKYFAASSTPRKIAIGFKGSGETLLEAVQACRVANAEWYGVYCPAAVEADHIAIADYIEALNDPYSMYFFQDGADGVKDGTAGNIFEDFKAALYRRTHGVFATQAHTVAGVMGYVAGQVSDLVDSAFTLKFKRLPTVTPVTLTSAQLTNILNNYGNAYIERAGRPMYENGRQFDGSWFDEIIYLDKLANNIQLNIFDALYQSTKVPQTEEGVALLVSKVEEACQSMVNIGFIAGGEWNGGNILSLQTGDYLPSGFKVMSEPLDDQPQADRDARKAPNIYAAVKLAGAIHSVIVSINVNR